MRPLQSVQRRTRFETLEAKKLFAADLMGGAAIDLPDTAIVDGFCTVSPATGSLSPASIGLVNANLGGQEGEDIADSAFASGVDSILQQSGIGLAGENFNIPNLGGQEGEDVTGDAATIVGGLVAEFDPGELVSVQMSPGNADVEFSARVFDGTGGFSYFANLGGQEGEPLIEESDLAASIAPDGCVDLADHVFGQYAEEIGAHNTQWDLLYAK